MPAPLGNANAVSHGLTARHHLQLGELPGKLKKVQRAAFALRREIEAAVVAEKGHISLLDAARIQTAVRLETNVQLARRWLVQALADLSEGERLAYLREIGRQSQDRDRVLRALGLDANGATTLEALYDMPTLADDQTNDAPTLDAPTLDAACDDADGPSTGSSSSGDDEATAGVTD